MEMPQQEVALSYSQKGPGQGISGETEARCSQAKADLEQLRGVSLPPREARKPTRA